METFKLVECRPGITKVRVNLDGAVEPIPGFSDLAF